MHVKLDAFYPHPPERVWQVLTSRRALADWLMDNDFEPRLGHRFCFHSTSPKLQTQIECEVIELDAPRRLAYTWRDRLTHSVTVVSWTLHPVEGGTQLRLEHRLTVAAIAQSCDPTTTIWNRSIPAELQRHSSCQPSIGLTTGMAFHSLRQIETEATGSRLFSRHSIERSSIHTSAPTQAMQAKRNTLEAVCAFNLNQYWQQKIQHQLPRSLTQINTYCEST
jgi:uncharacterized protein YndB with AHSA1/START domain